MIYLDNNATTRPDLSIMLEAMNETYGSFGNPSSWHEAGYDAKDLLEQARCSVAKAIGAKPSEVVFTSGGTEANNIALTYPARICSAVEHSSVWSRLNDSPIGVAENGSVDVSRLEQTLKLKEKDPRQTVVSVMLANNETGMVLDIASELRRLKDTYGFILHIDAVQGLGKLSIDVTDIQADLLTISGHKCYAPKGIGALFIRKNLEYKPDTLFSGGAHEKGYRPGTENIFGAVAFGKACDKYCSKEALSAISSEVRDYFESLLSDISDVNCKSAQRVFNTSSLYFPDIVDIDVFLDRLSINGLYASGKSACSSGMPAPSRIITVLFGEEKAKGTVRFSFAHDSTKEEAEKAVSIIRQTIREVKDGY